MSCVYRGAVVDTDLSKNARGGTEMMRDRLLRVVPLDLLEKAAIHFSRPRQIYDDVPNIFYAHDLAEDPENKILENGGWNLFHKIVFVSNWQKDQYVTKFGIPYSKCTVIENAIEKEYVPRKKPDGPIRFIYHTTPHRGLELLYPIFDLLSKQFEVHLDVFSSFEVYGWKERDKPYEKLFDSLRNHEKITYHGAQPNEVVLEALDRSHVFLYPCIWTETSCIALIEAIRSGCLCIHPNIGALPETASGASLIYDYDERPQEHANTAYLIAMKLLQINKEKPGYIESFSVDTPEISKYLLKNSIDHFRNKWVSLLKSVDKSSKV